MLWRVLVIVLTISLVGDAPLQAETLSLEIKPLADAPEGFDHIFTKEAVVFGIHIYATADVPDTKVSHAAHVLAQYLDNDEDGTPDNPLVVKAIRHHRGAMVMFATQDKAERIDVHRYIPERVWDNMILVGLFAEETHPAGSRAGRFDATLEEVLHLITSAGYARSYPETFGEHGDSKLAAAMDIARGGHYRRVPRRYPKSAWYSYYDRTCDYRCQLTEYIYWGLTSLLGAQSYPGRGKEIADEWRLNTPEKFKKGDAALYKLLSDAKYGFPRKLPNGRYGGANSATKPQEPVRANQLPD